MKKIKNGSLLTNKEDLISSILSRSKFLMDKHINNQNSLENSITPETLHEVHKKVHKLQKEFMMEHQKIVEDLEKVMGKELDADSKTNMEAILNHLDDLKAKEEQITIEYKKSYENYLEAMRLKKQTDKKYTPFSPLSFIQKKKEKGVKPTAKTVSKPTAKTVSNPTKNTNNVNKPTSNIQQALSSEVLQTVVSLSLQAFQSAIPPEFCWKKGADFGVIPTACPEGMFRSLALCYDYCPSNYTYVLGVCWENCSAGTDIGAMCVGGGVFKFKHSYISRSLTNFDNAIPCGEGMYKSGALCYRDCRNIGMANCGIGACSINSEACMSSIMNMVLSVIQGVVETIGFIVSFGGTAAIKTAVKSGLKNLGKGVIKGVMRTTKNYFTKIGKEAAKMKIKKYVKDKAKEVIKDTVTEMAQDVMIDKISESLISRSINLDINTFNEDYFISKVDVFGIGPAVTSCQTANNSSADAASCAEAVLNSIGTVDPTGLSTIAAAFAKPECDVPSTLSEEAKQIIEAEEKHRLELEKKVNPYCFKMWDGCNFTGNSMEVCKNTLKTKDVTLVNWKNKIASIITGVGVSLGASNVDADTQIKTGKFDFILMAPETKHPCIKDEFGKDWDKSIKILLFDFNTCFLFYEKPNFEGLKEAVCSSRDLRILKGKAQSYTKYSSEPSSITAFDESGLKGNSFTLDQVKEADLSAIGWENKIQSVKLIPVPQPDCVYVCEDCNYEGWCDNVCKDYAFSGINNKISSIKVGRNVKSAIFLDFLGTDSKYLIGNANAEFPCLKENGMDDIISNLELKGERCVIAYSGVDYSGKARVFCRSETIDGTMDKQINSIKRIDTNNTEIKITVYDEPNQLGDFIDINEDIPDLSTLEWQNKIRSIQFMDSNGME